MPRTDRRTTRTTPAIPDLTREYIGGGQPKPHTMASAKRAARTHFAASSGAGSWRGWAWVKHTAGKDLVCLQITRARSGSTRIGDVTVFGTTTVRG